MSLDCGNDSKDVQVARETIWIQVPLRGNDKVNKQLFIAPIIKEETTSARKYIKVYVYLEVMAYHYPSILHFHRLFRHEHIIEGLMTF